MVVDVVWFSNLMREDRETGMVGRGSLVIELMSWSPYMMLHCVPMTCKNSQVIVLSWWIRGCGYSRGTHLRIPRLE